MFAWFDEITLNPSTIKLFVDEVVEETTEEVVATEEVVEATEENQGESK